MRQDFLQETAKMNKVHRTEKRTHRTAGLISLGIVLATVSSLVLPAITMNRELICGKEEHSHSEECYLISEEALCGLEEGHVHGEECYSLERGELTCDLEESDGHTHVEDCYDPESHELICGLEESEGHTHGDACYEQIKTLTCELEEGHVHTEECYRYLACGKEEHVHGDECYREASDDTADLENKEIWEKSLASVTLTGDYAEDLLAIARTQLGYTESTENFRYNTAGGKNGYTRYGEWYGDAYGDWCAMFISFCLRYANVPEEVIPSAAGCTAWVSELKTLGRFADAGFTPRVGDLVFFDRDGLEESNTTHVGIVAALEEDSFLTVEGNHYDKVCCGEYAYDHAEIYGYGLLSEVKDETKLAYEDENLSATLTLAPALSGTATLSLEKLDPKEDTELWKNMALPLVETAQEEEEELDALDLYRFRVTRNGEELDLQDYELTLEAKAEKPALKEETPEEEEGLRSYALLLLSEEELAALEAEKEEPEEEAEIDPIAYALAALLPADLEEPADEETEEAEENEEALPAIRAEALENWDYSEEAELNYSGAGKVYGFALAALPKKDEAPLLLKSAPRMMGAMLGETAPAVLPHSKTIDYLGDGQNNPDTTLDTNAADNSNLYRLYLDFGPMQSSQPLDLLIIVDQSGSMASNSDVTVNGKKMRRDNAVTYLLNGSTTEATEDGIISRFLAMNSENMVAVARFGGDPNTKNGSNDHKTLQEWTGSPVFVNANTKTNIGTNYNAGLKEGHDLLIKDAVKENGHKKVVVFISDGVPTFASELTDDWKLGTRQGDGSESNSANGGKYANAVKTATEAAITKFQTAHEGTTVATIGIGKFQTQILSEMNYNGGKTYTSSDYEGLLSAMQEIIAASTEKITNIVIEDELSDYVQFIDNNWASSDLLVQSVSKEGVKTNLYQNGAVTEAGKTLLSSTDPVKPVKVEGKKITVTFDPKLELPLGTTLRLSYNVEVTAKAFEDYKSDNTYGNIVGDTSTDFTATSNTSSSGKPGYHSNKEAKVSFTRNEAAGSYTYSHPVVQVKEKPAPTPVETDSPKLPISKQIDFLGDKKDNPDTTLDNAALGTSDNLKELYRLYLSAGPVGQMNPMDMLIVVDQSTSMNTKDMDGGRRDDAVTKILNGSLKGVTSDGLISQFLEMNAKNHVAVISFFGNVSGSYGGNPVSNFPVSADTATLLNWTDAAGWAGKGVVDCTCKSRSGTDYSAAFVKMTEMLEIAAIKNNGQDKVVVFLSDGVPTFYLSDGTTTGKYTRHGNGSDSNAAQTPDAFTRYFTGKVGKVPPVYTIGIGNFSTDVLNTMSTDTNGQLYTARDYTSLLNSLKEIMTGNMKTFRDLTIKDTLSENLQIYADQPDFKVTVKTKEGSEIILYRNSSKVAGSFSHESSDSADASYFTADGLKYLKGVAYDETNKTVTAVFNSGVDLVMGSTYTVSFNGQLTAAAYSAANKTANTGDAGTDFTGNSTSSEKSGLYSNKSEGNASSVTFTYQNVNYVEDYAKPVVQVPEVVPPEPVEVTIDQNKTIDWLGDYDKTANAANNTDTSVDDVNSSGVVSINDIDDLYRLYLDLGSFSNSDPVDLVIVVDESSSMTSGKMNYTPLGTGTHSYINVVKHILNGCLENNKYSNTGLVADFLRMNPENLISIVGFDAGERVRQNWTKTAGYVSISTGSGTNYCGGLKVAISQFNKVGDALYRSDNGHRKIMVFMSDGAPSKYYDNNGKLKPDSGYDEDLSMVESIAYFKEHFEKDPVCKDDVLVYSVGMGNFKTEALNFYSSYHYATGDDNRKTYDKNTFTATDGDALLGNLKSIVTGGNMQALVIKDTLSEYVELYGPQPDFKVTMKTPGTSGTVTTLYECSKPFSGGTLGDFTDTNGSANSHYTEKGKELLSEVKYDHASKTVTVTFKTNVTLDKANIYTVSYNVKATNKAYDDFRSNEKSDLGGYGGMVGDAGTDYTVTGNSSSSNQGGFRANAKASTTYSLTVGDGGTATTMEVPYDFPVIQVDKEEMKNTLDIIVSKRWGQDVTDETIDGISKIRVNLYKSTAENPLAPETLMPVLGADNQPITLELLKANDWSAKLDGLPAKDASGNAISYYIQEVNETSNSFPFHPVYSDPVSGVTIGDETNQTVGRISDMVARSEYETVGNAWVRNDLLVELPETGGGGTESFLALGLALMATAGTLLAVNKKNSKDKKERYEQ